MITFRQEEILKYIKEKGSTSNREIRDFVVGKYGDISRHTIIRDIDSLRNMGLIESSGKGRSVVYELSAESKLSKNVDVEEYFKILPGQRKIKATFDFSIFGNLQNIILPIELKELEKLNKKYQDNISNISPTISKKEFERLTIELSWKSSHIEGNTYNLLETEQLIKERIEAKGHTREEAIMILNHKEALDFVRINKGQYKDLSMRKIEDVHYLLTKEMGISRNMRKGQVGITGTGYRPLDNEFQIKEALEKTCIAVDGAKDVYSKALLLNLLIAYIQPFEDGNKRTSRLMGNAVLMAYDACPLSFRSIDELEYKKAIILFYEQNNLKYFKELFIEQFKFAVENYFRN